MTEPASKPVFRVTPFLCLLALAVGLLDCLAVWLLYHAARWVLHG